MNTAWRNIIALNMFYEGPIANNKKWTISKITIAQKTLSLYFPRDTTFVPKFLKLPLDFVF